MENVSSIVVESRQGDEDGIELTGSCSDCRHTRRLHRCFHGLGKNLNQGATNHRGWITGRAVHWLAIAAYMTT